MSDCFFTKIGGKRTTKILNLQLKNENMICDGQNYSYNITVE